jgi:hypothetical protein
MRSWKILLVLVFSLTMFAGCKDGLSKATDTLSKGSKKGTTPAAKFIEATDRMILEGTF